MTCYPHKDGGFACSFDDVPKPEPVSLLDLGLTREQLGEIIEYWLRKFEEEKVRAAR